MRDDRGYGMLETETALTILNGLQTWGEQASEQTIILNTWGFDKDDAIALQPMIRKVEQGESLDYTERRIVARHTAKYAGQMYRLESAVLNGEDMAPMVARAAEILMRATLSPVTLVEMARGKGWGLAKAIEFARAHGMTEEEIEAIRKEWGHEEPIPSGDERRRNVSRMGGQGLSF